MAAKAPKILVADDDRSIRELLGFVVGFAGAAAVPASDGEEAIAGVLTDLNMPKMSGDELTHQVKALSPGRPVYAITGAEGGGKHAEMLKNLKAAGRVFSVFAQNPGEKDNGLESSGSERESAIGAVN